MELLKKTVEAREIAFADTFAKRDLEAFLTLWVGIAAGTDDPAAREVLAQDAASLVRTFARLGIEADADEVLRTVTAEH